MRKGTYVCLMFLVSAVLGGCHGNDEKKAADVAKKAEENTKQVEEMEEEFVFREEEHTAVLTKYNGADSDVQIPEEYNGMEVVAIEEGTFSNYGHIKSITIPCSVTRIEDSNLETLAVTDGFGFRVYSHSAGELYALQQGIPYETIGVNETQATSVVICDKEGVGREIITLDSEPESDTLKGVSFRQENGKSILTLDNCDIGNIIVEEIATLTIELAEGSSNVITGNNGADGINCWSNLTVTGNGQLKVTGSDFTSVREGEQSSVGYGIWVWGNLNIENQAKVIVKAGKSSSIPVLGIVVERGWFAVKDSFVEAIAGTDSDMNGAALFLDIDEEKQSGKLEMTNTEIKEGGKLIPVMDEDTAYRYTAGTEDKAVYVMDKGYDGSSEYVRIEPK